MIRVAARKPVKATPFERTAAQGELYLQKIPRLPKGLVQMKPVKGKLIVGHSETGHHHVVDAETANVYQDPSNPLNLFMEAVQPTALVHLRPTDTHGPIAIEKGDIVQVNVGREFEPKQQVWNRSRD